MPTIKESTTAAFTERSGRNALLPIPSKTVSGRLGEYLTQLSLTLFLKAPIRGYIAIGEVFIGLR